LLLTDVFHRSQQKLYVDCCFVNSVEGEDSLLRENMSADVVLRFSLQSRLNLPIWFNLLDDFNQDGVNSRRIEETCGEDGC
jgi:hypothetical protein